MDDSSPVAEMAPSIKTKETKKYLKEKKNKKKEDVKKAK